ncbi:PAS domain S-box protein [Desulfurispira natronophila]|uniref:histidine kinase n=1 Tax=Desulfurispira natronophila TaxID=682562 RepID=A0A7W8DH78_9BACT|nr:PAS domain S-box protein [Desulfurispira natronophila]MBB5022008.1 PAS domain S-box-containing protein [Desulfurispira natronophila]
MTHRITDENHRPFAAETYTSLQPRMRALLALLAVIFIATVGLALLSHHFMKNHMLQQQLKNTEDLLTTVASSSITPWVNTRLRYIDTLSYEDDLLTLALERQATDTLMERWQTLLDYSNDIFFIYFGDREGNVTMLPDDEPLPPDFNMFERPWYLRATESPGQIAWTDLYDEIITGIPQISAVVTVHDPESLEPVGVMALDVSLHQLRRIVMDVELPSDAELVLLDRNHQLIVSSTGKNYSQLSDTWQKKTPDQRDRGYFSRDNSDMVFASSTRIPSTQWQLVLFTPRDSFYAPIDPLRNLGILAGFVVMGVSLVFTYYFLSALSRRARELSNYFHESLTESFVPRQVMSGNDEFTWLNQQFNAVIGERNLSQAALAESQRRLSALMANLPGIAYRCRNDEQRTMEFVSDGCKQLTGYTPSQLIDNADISFMDIVHPDDRQTLRTRWKEALQHRQPLQHEYRIIKGDGQECWLWEQGAGIFDREGSVTALEGFITDISLRKQAELLLEDFNQQLRQQVDMEVSRRLRSERNFRILFEKSPEGILILNQQGVFVQCNSMAARTLGYAPEEIIGLSPADLSPPLTHLSQQPSTEVIGRIITEAFDQEMTSLEWQHLHRDGHLLTFRILLTPISRGNGSELLVVWHDMTQVYALQQEREQQQAILIQQAKMAELGSMIGAIAHQWNQPLSTISIVIQSLIDLYEFNELSQEELYDATGTILQQVEFMSQTVDDFRTFFSPSKSPQPFSVSQCVAQVENLVSTRFVKHNIQLKRQQECDEALLAQGYPGEFKQVILNILSNACDALAEAHIHEPTIVITVEEQPDCITLNVEDNAGGIDPGLLPDKLFEAFITTKEQSGSGIGLWMSRLIMEKMGGRIEAANTSSGARFTLVLPRPE